MNMPLSGARLALTARVKKWGCDQDMEGETWPVGDGASWVQR